ncbi:hypothetical protein Avbf_03685 [Armadillidium vulgare]|nr:hypothetical protein Avbf_03685 [Armadillidium vulgare]
MNIKMKKRIPLLCSIIRQNFQSYQILKPIYPGNIFFVRYEDLARFPFVHAGLVFVKIYDLWFLID